MEAEIGLCASARTERCAGEGELLLGLTKHGVILAERGRAVNTRFFRVVARFWPVLGKDRRHLSECGVPKAEWRVRKGKVCRIGIILRGEEPDRFQVRAGRVRNPILAHDAGCFRLAFNRSRPDLLTCSANCMRLASSKVR